MNMRLIAQKVAKAGSQFCQFSKAFVKLTKTYKILTKWQHFAKSGHTGHLGWKYIFDLQYIVLVKSE